jgi:hypothetical protein
VSLVLQTTCDDVSVGWLLFWTLIGLVLLLSAWAGWDGLRNMGPTDAGCLVLILPLLLLVCFLGGAALTFLSLGSLVECNLQLDVPYFD